MEWLTFAAGLVLGLLVGLVVGSAVKSSDPSSAALVALGQEMGKLSDKQSGYVTLSVEFGKVKADDGVGDAEGMPDDPSESWRNN